MGFDQDSTTHHFRLFETGGGIQVVTNDPADATGRDQIRMHLREIAADFANGNFAKPFMTHGEVPPGVKTMQARKGTLSFTYEDSPDGGRCGSPRLTRRRDKPFTISCDTRFMSMRPAIR